MLRLSHLTDYGVVLLSQLAQEAPALVTAPGLAASTGLPAPTVAKLLKVLTHAGLVSSHRGAAGGYTLARSPVCISVGEVIAAIDGPLALTACVEGAVEVCKVESSCPIRGRWSKVNAALKHALSEISIAELATPGSPVHDMPAASGVALSH
ncbi:MAG: SUF system Fe-S cluster assembly regulator [Alphaproteobacteria bacterium]|nr:SUF system Fe-S cluster assembly regulator [Alphaproteobacteria bacterium]